MMAEKQQVIKKELKDHWFWGAILENRAVYVQVIFG